MGGMNRNELYELAARLKAGELDLSEFVDRLAGLHSPLRPAPVPDSAMGKPLAPPSVTPPVVDVGDAQVDIDRARRCGFPEVVFAEGKTVDAIEKIIRALLDHGADVLTTRMDPQQAAALQPKFPDGRYNPVARTFRVPVPGAQQLVPQLRGKVAIVTAGTSDLPVAEEARETAQWTGAEVVVVQDVGVAGPHRLRANLPLLEGADAVVVVAGMEGALPSVVGGYVSCPVIGVPTSVGYGASLGGLSALLSMLNSCAANVVTVNIDAGFKGGYVAGLIARNAAKARAAAGEPARD